VVTVLAVLQYVGGGLTVANALFGLASAGGAVTGSLPAWGQALYGLFYVGLARAMQLGWRWARRIALALCWIGLALAMVYVLVRGPQAALAQAVWPAVYLVLLTRPGVREWFAPRAGVSQ
jgi:hypothetical protein